MILKGHAIGELATTIPTSKTRHRLPLLLDRCQNLMVEVAASVLELVIGGKGKWGLRANRVPTVCIKTVIVLVSSMLIQSGHTRCPEVTLVAVEQFLVMHQNAVGLQFRASNECVFALVALQVAPLVASTATAPPTTTKLGKIDMKNGEGGKKREKDKQSLCSFGLP